MISLEIPPKKLILLGGGVVFSIIFILVHSFFSSKHLTNCNGINACMYTAYMYQTSSVSLPLEPAAFSVKTILQTRNRKVISPHLAPMSLTRQVIFNGLMFSFFLFIPRRPLQALE